MSPRQVQAELDRLEPGVARAFLREVQRLVDAARVGVIESAASDGDIALIDASIALDQRALADLLDAARDVYIRGATLESNDLRPPRAIGRIRFDARNLRAEEWLRNQSSRLVTQIRLEQREAIQAAVTQGAQLGRNPRQTALDIVGRVSRQTGRRSGGIVGLSGPQSQYVATARAQLLSGDPSQMSEYFSRARRDQRFDGIVKRAIDAGKPVPATDVDRIVGRYADRLLMLRGETIARTETLTAFNAGQQQVYEQMVSDGQVRSDSITSAWSAKLDTRTRDAHRSMNRQTVAWGKPFRSPTGALMMHPGDTSMGASARDVVGCRCVAVRRVDWLAEGLGNGR